MGKVCIAVTGTTAAGMLARAEESLQESTFLEFRLDYLDKPAAALPRLREWLAAHTTVTAIATCRRAGNGGRYAGEPAAELDLLLKATAAGFHLVDVELETAEAVQPAGLRKLRESGTGIILSWHDFKRTGDLDAVLARMTPYAADLYKIVPTARRLADSIALLRFVERVSDTAAVVGIAMGEAGVLSRVLGLRAGSVFTFASTGTGAETAPGQISARAMVEQYRVGEIDAATRIYGVAGHPAGKSLSPAMMNAAFRRETVNAAYVTLETTDVRDLVDAIQAIPLHGVSVTMPHKQAILEHLEHMDPLAAKIGAVNTVLRAPDGKLYGFNTDVAGVIVPLEKRIALPGARILLLGAGGAARAAVFALRDKGAEVHILNRTPETATLLAKQSGAKVAKRETLHRQAYDAIVNATPVGMSGNKAAPLLTAADFDRGLTAKLVFDMVYNPVETPLLRLARERSIAVITGVEMFLQQGARQFEIWTGKPAPQEEMLRVVAHALRQAGPAATTPAASAPGPAAAAVPSPKAGKPAVAPRRTGPAS